jgi:hypothetical protein
MPALPIGTPPPKAQVAPLLAKSTHISVSNNYRPSKQTVRQRGVSYASSRSAVIYSTHFGSVVVVVGLESRSVCPLTIVVLQLESNQSA